VEDPQNDKQAAPEKSRQRDQRDDAARVKVFGTATCGWCRRAEALLERRHIVFEKIDVTGDPDAREALVEASGGRRTVPVIFVDGRVVGGYEELVRFLDGGGLERAAPDRYA
jgi:glutaredoxin 3